MWQDVVKGPFCSWSRVGVRVLNYCASDKISPKSTFKCFFLDAQQCNIANGVGSKEE